MSYFVFQVSTAPRKQWLAKILFYALNKYLQEFCDSGTKTTVLRLGFKSLLRQNNQVALFLRKPFQSNFALQQFFNLCFLLNYKSIIKGDFSVSFDFRRKNMRLGSCWPLKNRKLKKCCKGKTLVKCSANFKKNVFLRPIETAGKSRKCPTGALVSGGSTKNTFCVFKKFPKTFFVTFEPLRAKKT